MLLQAFYGIRSERQLMERLEFDLLFHWFVGLGVDGPVWDHSTFSKNRARLLEGEIAARFLAAVLAQPKIMRLLSSDHFSVDGTLIEAWASIKSFRRRDGSDNDNQGSGRNAERDFDQEKRVNETHQSAADPQARLYRKGAGQPAKLCYMGHVLMENQNGLAVGGVVSQATGTVEREKALELIDGRQGRRRLTLGADKAYDVTQFVHDLRARSVTPHIAVDGHLTKTGKRRNMAINGRTTRHAAYDISQQCRKRIEEVFGWIKSSAGMAKIKLRGCDRVDAAFTLALAAYNLVRRPKLLEASRMKGKWRIVKMPDYTSDYPDMVEPAYLLIDGKGDGEFVVGCVTGTIHEAGDSDAIEFDWSGNDQTEKACGDGCAQLQPDGSLEGQIRVHGSDEVDFTARPWKTSSKAC